MDSLRQPLALFMGAVAGSGLWLLWVVVAGGLLDPLVRTARDRLSSTPGTIVSSMLFALILLPAAFVFARLAGAVAGRMTPMPYMRRITFYLSLMLDALMVVLLFVYALINAMPA